MKLYCVVLSSLLGITTMPIQGMQRGAINVSKKLFERSYAKRKESNYFQKTKKLLQKLKKEHHAYQKARLSDKQSLEKLRAQQEMLHKKIESCEVGLFSVLFGVGIGSIFLWR